MPAATAARASSSDPSTVGGAVVDARGGCGSAGRSRRWFTYDRARMFSSIVVGTDGSETAGKAVLQATELARQVGASVSLVSAYEPVSGNRAARGEARGARRTWSGWSTRARTSRPRSRRRPRSVEGAGVKVDTFAREGDAADAILDVAEETRRRPDRGRQQGHDRHQALPARLGAEQGLPPRALQRADHPDDVALRRDRARRVDQARRRSASPGRAGRGRAPSPSAAPRPAAGVGCGPMHAGGDHERGGRGHVRRRHRRADVAARQPEVARPSRVE